MGRNSGEPAVRRVIFLGCDLPPYKIVADSPSDDTRAPRLPRDWSLDLVFSDLEGAQRLDEFEAAILPYDAFLVVDRDDGFRFRNDSRDRRLREIVNLFEAGGVVCFLLDRAPRHWVARYTPGMFGDPAAQTLEGDSLFRAYPAAAFLGAFGLELAHEYGQSEPFVHATRGEFQVWLNQWGGARYEIEVTDDEAARGAVPICRVGKDGPLTGCALPCASGHIVVLQWAPGGWPHEELGKAVLELARALVRFRDNVHTEPAAWLSDLTFEKERPLLEERKEVESRLAELDSELKCFADYKSLLYLRDYELERRVPAVLSKFGIRTRTSEGAEEDFRILNDSDEQLAICEVKGLSANVTRQHVGRLDEHRKARGLPDDFPAVLFVNTFTRAASLKEKDQEVPSNVRERAAQDNVIIVRTLDLLRLLDAVDVGRLQPSDLVGIFTTRKGWLQVEPGGAWQTLPK